MDERPRYVHRTLNTSPSRYEATLSRTLFGILSRSIHDLAGIVNALNDSDVRPPEAAEWTKDNFVAEMARLGAYPNSVGAPLGEHPVGVVPPGTSSRERPKREDHGERSDGT